MIKRKAKACPHCGSDERTGWSDETYLDGIDLGDDIDYEEMVAKEFSNKNYSQQWWKSWRVVTAIVLLLLFLIVILRYL